MPDRATPQLRPEPSVWMGPVLAAAGLWHFVTGLYVTIWPENVFRIFNLPLPTYPELVMMGGLMTIVCGVIFFIAASDPFRHWLALLGGLLCKFILPICLGLGIDAGHWPLRFAMVALPNDVFWLAPLSIILYRTLTSNLGQPRIVSPEMRRMSLRARTQQGLSLEQLSSESPILLVFLRHVGCTFCREALSDLAAQRRKIEVEGTRIVLVHMGREQQASEILKQYALDDVPRVADKSQAVYRAFGLGRGSAMQLFGPQVIWRGFVAGLLGKHGVHAPEGDTLQMPGVFLLFHGEVLKSYVHRTAADRPNYAQLVRQIDIHDIEMSN
jgi:peroxiredoxin